MYPPTQFGPQAPEGIAFGKNGNLYVALAGASHISVLDPGGNEVNRWVGPAKIPNSNATVAWANPANIAFNDGEDTILVTNHASLVSYDPALFLVFDVRVNESGAPLP